MRDPASLSRRERQIMDIVYRKGTATAAQVQRELPDPPSYSAVRAMLRLLEEKGHLRHEKEGQKFVYSATVGLKKARRFALRHLLATFFDNSAEEVVATLLDLSGEELSAEELQRVQHLIEAARQEGR